MTKVDLRASIFVLIITMSLLLQIPFISEESAAEDGQTQEWNMFRQNYLHTGYMEGLAPDTNQTNWIFDTNSTRWVVSSPMIVDDYVYIGSDNGQLYKLYLDNGTKVWNYTAGSGCLAQFWSSPYVDKENNMVFCHANGVHAINATTGEQIWHFDTNNREFSSPVVHDGVVFLGTYSKRVYALDEMTGDVIWYYEAGEYQNGNHVEGTGGAVSSTMAIVDDMVIGAEQTNYDEGNNYCDYNIFVLPEEDPDDNGVIEHGEIIWKYEIGTHIPIIDTGVPGDNGDCFSSASVNLDLEQVYIGSRDMYMYCFDLYPDGDGLDNDGDGIFDNEGELVWRTQADNEIFSTPSIHNGTVFFGTGEYSQVASAGSVFALNEENGNEIWSYQNTDGYLSSPLVADNKVYIGANNDVLQAFVETNGSVIWEYQADNGTQNAFGSSPSLYNDQIILGNCNGKVYSFHTPRINYPPTVENTAPEAGSRITGSTTLRWEGNDPNQHDNLQYLVFLSTSKFDVDHAKTSAIVTEDWLTTQSYETETLSQGSSYYWRVLVYDGEESDLSNTWEFEVNSKPEIQLLEPEDGKRLQDINVTLEWEGTDQEDDEITYDVYLDTSQNPSTPVSIDIANNTYEASELEDGETYYWKITAKDGFQENHSEIRNFTIDISSANNVAPTIELTEPEDGSIISSTTVTLKWSGEDENDDDLKYSVYFGKDTGSETLAAENITEEYYEVSELEDGLYYNWKVVVSDGLENTESYTYGFEVDLDHVDNYAPTVELKYPKDKLQFKTNTINFVWKGEDEEDDDLTYDFYLGTSENNTPLVSEDQVQDKYFAADLEYDTTYFWKVVVDDGEKEGNSEIWSFEVLKEKKDDDDDDEFIPGFQVIVTTMGILVSVFTRKKIKTR